TSDLVGQDAQVPEIGSMAGPGAPAFSLPKGAISAPINTGQGGVILSVIDKQEPTAEETAKNFDQTREQLLEAQRAQIFNVFLGTLTKKYEDGGGVKMSKQSESQDLP